MHRIAWYRPPWGYPTAYVARYRGRLWEVREGYGDSYVASELVLGPHEAQPAVRIATRLVPSAAREAVRRAADGQA